MTSLRSIAIASLALAIAATGCKKKPPTDVISDAGPVVAPAPVAQVQAPPHVQKLKENFSRVHFGYDSAGLDAQAKAALKANAEIMAKHPDLKIEVQGHCDERGTTDYNLALGQRRADAVRGFLTAQGVSPSRLSHVSYGEEKPLQRGQSETAWSQNRRAEFRITWDAETVAQGTVD